MGYQQGGPPQQYQPQPAPAGGGQPQAFDFGSLLSKVSRGDMVIGGALLLLFVFSFIGAIDHVSISQPCTQIGTQCVGGSDFSGSYNGLWGDVGIIAALLIIAGIAFWILRVVLSDQVKLPVLPLPDWQIWMAVGGAGIILTFLHWLISKGSGCFSVNGFSGCGDVPNGASTSPGWNFYFLILLWIALIVGGYLKQQDPVPGAGAGSTPTGGYGAYAGYQQPQQPGYAAPPQQPPAYGAPPQQPPAYGAPPQQPYGDPSQQQGYGQQPPTGYPPQQ